MKKHNFFGLSLICLFINFSLSMAQASEPKCLGDLKDVAPDGYTEIISPIFERATQEHGPQINALVRYGSSALKNSTFLNHGRLNIIRNWGFNVEGEAYVRVEDSETHEVSEIRLSEFPRGAFRIKKVKLDDIMNYQNPLVVERTMHDHPGMTRATAERAFEELKKWFFLKYRARIENTTPPFMYDEIDTIDYAWHAFLLFTDNYAEFGQKYFATFLHHRAQSYLDSVPDTLWVATHPKFSQKADQRKKETLDFIKETLGEETLEAWFLRQDFNPHTPLGVNRVGATLP